MFGSGVHVWFSSISTGVIALMVGTVSNCADAMRLKNRNYRISHVVGTVSNCADAVRLDED